MGPGLKPIEEMPAELSGQVLVYGRVWAMLDDAGKEDMANWELPKFYLLEKIEADGRIIVNPSFVTGDLAECRATFWCELTPPQ